MKIFLKIPFLAFLVLFLGIFSIAFVKKNQFKSYYTDTFLLENKPTPLSGFFPELLTIFKSDYVDLEKVYYYGYGLDDFTESHLNEASFLQNLQLVKKYILVSEDDLKKHQAYAEMFKAYAHLLYNKKNEKAKITLHKTLAYLIRQRDPILICTIADSLNKGIRGTQKNKALAFAYCHLLDETDSYVKTYLAQNEKFWVSERIHLAMNHILEFKS